MKTFKEFIKEELDYFDKQDRIAMYAAENLFFLDAKNMKRIGKGSCGVAYEIDGKIIKITDDIQETRRAERLRGKHTKNLMGYYDAREINYYNDTYYALLMDKLPILLMNRMPHTFIYNLLNNRFGPFDDNESIDVKQQRRDKILSTRKRDRLSEIKRQVNEMFDLPVYIKRVEELPNDLLEIKEISYKMLDDLINMKVEMKKFGISNNDMHKGNLGFDKHDNLVFFDIGYEGSGEKELRKSKKLTLKDKDMEPLLKKYGNI